MSTRRRPAAAAAADDPLLRLDRQLCFALYSTSLAMTKLYKATLAPLGLTYPQYLVLLALWERDVLSVGELGDRLCLDSGTLTPLLKRMETAGLLRRRRAAADERRVLVELTEAGGALRKPGRDVPRRVSSATGCTPAEMSELTARLQQLRSHLHAATDLPTASTGPRACVPASSASPRRSD